MTNKAESPNLNNRRKSTPKPPPDFGKDSAEITRSASEQRAAPEHEDIDDVVVQLNTRISLRHKRMLAQLSRDQGKTIRALVEDALDQAYSN